MSYFFGSCRPFLESGPIFREHGRREDTTIQMESINSDSTVVSAEGHGMVSSATVYGISTVTSPPLVIMRNLTRYTMRKLCCGILCGMKYKMRNGIMRNNSKRNFDIVSTFGIYLLVLSGGNS